MRSSTIRRSRIRRVVTALFAVLALAAPVSPASAALEIDPAQLYKQMKASYDKGAAAGWHLADQLDYFSAVLEAGRAYELRRRDDPQNVAIQGVAVDLATQLGYDPLTNNDAAEWYVRVAAVKWQTDTDRGSAAQALIAKLDAEDADPARLARDADADAAMLAQRYPGDVQALLGQLEADLRAYNLTGETAWRLLALLRAALSSFGFGSVPRYFIISFFWCVVGGRTAGPC
jgi:hypothetical protein